jgi:hypothetical protein
MRSEIMPDARGHQTHREWFEQYMERLDKELPHGALGASAGGVEDQRQSPGNSLPGVVEKQIPDLIRDVWERDIKPKLQADTDELNRRLARRRNGMMNRPPRAWCLAVRSADSRITLATARIEPEMSVYPRELVAERKYA